MLTVFHSRFVSFILFSSATYQLVTMTNTNRSQQPHTLKTLSDFSTILNDNTNIYGSAHAQQSEPTIWNSFSNITRLWQDFWNGQQQPEPQTQNEQLTTPQQFILVNSQQPHNSLSTFTKRGDGLIQVVPYIYTPGQVGAVSAPISHSISSPVVLQYTSPPYVEVSALPQLLQHTAIVNNPHYMSNDLLGSTDVSLANSISPQRDQTNAGANEVTQEFIRRLLSALGEAGQVFTSTYDNNSTKNYQNQHRDSLELMDVIQNSQEETDELIILDSKPFRTPTVTKQHINEFYELDRKTHVTKINKRPFVPLRPIQQPYTQRQRRPGHKSIRQYANKATLMRFQVQPINVAKLITLNNGDKFSSSLKKFRNEDNNF